MTSNTYTSAQKFLHWTLFALVVFLYGLTYGEDLLPRGAPTVDVIWRLHISFGLLLAGFVLWRVVLRGIRGHRTFRIRCQFLSELRPGLGTWCFTRC
ncbi:cytochrome b/b6 domain-containing protein [Mesorhizobium sp. ESP6-5]|uniref:cytochrome b n=1 Tax=Mesorhizobium sp. ESP6-5 TaxID=2876623 RepID=UPI001CC9E024|nr:cytochrome b/b6 domain-containing protein [Mesorhizobium sp. ESP6-5]MBZ9757308.1 cytochrome b/b6 domain-containing protein [Mesorhizobium sp. ESP6-5]